MTSSNQTYTIELFKSNKRVVLEFKINNQPLTFDSKKRKLNNQHDKNGFSTAEHEVQIQRINGLQIIDGDAVAYSFELDYGGTILTYINHNGDYYTAEKTVYYWFPGKKRPKELTDGSVEIHLNNTKELNCVYARPLDIIPFMDLTGNFVCQFETVGYDQINEDKKVHKSCSMPITLIEVDDKFTVMIDNLHKKCYSIHSYKTFREMRLLNMQ